MDKICKCIYKPENILKWDKNLKHSEVIDIDEGKKSYGFIYMSNKKIFTFDTRDFYEKSF